MSVILTRGAAREAPEIDYLPIDLDAQRLAATYENAALAISEVDAEGRLLRVNGAATVITGYSREELLSRKVFDFTVPDDRDADTASYRRQVAGHLDRYVVEKRLTRKDGRVIWVSVTSSTLCDPAGRFLYGIRVMHDITERKRREEMLRVSEQNLRNLLAVLPAAIYTTDAEGKITSYNQAAVDLWGRAPKLGSDEWCGSWRIYRPDGTRLPHDQCPMAQAIREDRPIRGAEAVAERPDGTRAPFLPYPTPLHDESGTLIGAINMLVDITDRKAHTILAERLASIVESSDDAIVSKDLNGIIKTWNKGAERVFGYSAAEAIGQPITMIIPQDRRNEEARVIARIRAGERIDHYETIRRRKDGSMVDISLSVSPIADGDGNIVGASKIARDITERRRAERQRHVLVGELNHRVKNTLATMQSIASQTFRGNGEPRDLLWAFEGRLFALSRAHDQLSRESWEAADLHATLEGIFAPYGTGEKGRIRVVGEPVRLSPQVAVAFAMVLHELATNAAKYGALSRPHGEVEVKWNVSNSGLPPLLEMVWQETGGPPVKPPKRAGFGSRFIDRAVSQELNGKVEVAYDSGGLRCRIEVPLPSL